MLKAVLNRLNGSDRTRFLFDHSILQVIEGLAHVRQLISSLTDRVSRLPTEIRAVAAASTQPTLNIALEQARQANLQYQRARFADRFGPIELRSEKLVAADSPDHIMPWGTAQDNHINLDFNAKLAAWILPRDLRLLDLGCSGGGQVRSFVEQGCFAVGIEGSDYSARHLRAEWATIPELLFTADITAPFQLTAGGSALRFSVITLWEVIEHIHRRDLPALFANLDAHLVPGGVVIMSVSTVQDTIRGVDLHQTVEGPEWWMSTIDGLGFQNHPDIVAWFGNDMVRWEANAAGSFHVILTRKGEAPLHADRATRLTAPKPLSPAITLGPR